MLPTMQLTCLPFKGDSFSLKFQMSGHMGNTSNDRKAGLQRYNLSARRKGQFTGKT